MCLPTLTKNDELQKPLVDGFQASGKSVTNWVTFLGLQCGCECTVKNGRNPHFVPA